MTSIDYEESNVGLVVRQQEGNRGRVFVCRYADNACYVRSSMDTLRGQPLHFTPKNWLVV